MIKNCTPKVLPRLLTKNSLHLSLAQHVIEFADVVLRFFVVTLIVERTLWTVLQFHIPLMYHLM